MSSTSLLRKQRSSDLEQCASSTFSMLRKSRDLTLHSARFTLGLHVCHRSPANGTNMKTALNLAGLIFIIMGGIWFLQGINVLPGSFMTGQTRWAIYGGIAVIVGIVLFIAANRRRSS
jgi:hypothetical protein